MKMVSSVYHNSIPEMLPVIPTMDVVVFPHIIVPLLVLDEKIIRGIEQALDQGKRILLLAAQSVTDNQGAIGTNDLYNVGTVASIMRLIKMPEGGIKILVQGMERVRVTELVTHDNMLQAYVETCELIKNNPQELQEILHSIRVLTEQMASTGHTFSPDFHIILSKMHDPEKIADFILSHLNLSVDQAQTLLESADQKLFLEGLYFHLKRETEAAEIQEKIKNSARDSMNQSQKEFYLREQLRAIKQELGEDDMEEIEVMRDKLDALNLPEELKTDIMRNISRLERTTPDSLEANVTRTHLEWIFALPWNVTTEDTLDLEHAKQVLNQDHYGLKEIKDRILDFISIRNLKKDGYAPILCFVGPPGTGKTSFGHSIAKCLGRSYARISLGGVKDEAEIRGHRRTYVGAMPGRFIQAIRKAGSSNPVIVIDELDKIGSDFRGDPSAAMLEVLDPHQNKTFYDNYLGIPFDLSKVMFIATANTIDTISDPLRDRLEIIELGGYTVDEKVNIAQQYLIKKSLADAGLESHLIAWEDIILQDIITNYTRESGVRQLERLIRKLASKIARALVETRELISITQHNLEHCLGPRKFIEEDVSREDQIGISHGLAWTAYGGELLKIEAVLMPGKGKMLLTGQLGDVMKESAQAALSYARVHAKEFGIDHRLFYTHDLHIHVPAGAIPKDGPSAGITILTAILSALTDRPINAQYAMTGELNLRGEVLPIGGAKEKILTAIRNKVPFVILPHKNKNDVVAIEELVHDIDLIFVHHADEVLDLVLLPKNQLKSRKQS